MKWSLHDHCCIIQLRGRTDIGCKLKFKLWYRELRSLCNSTQNFQRHHYSFIWKSYGSESQLWFHTWNFIFQPNWTFKWYCCHVSTSMLCNVIWNLKILWTGVQNCSFTNKTPIQCKTRQNIIFLTPIRHRALQPLVKLMKEIVNESPV